LQGVEIALEGGYPVTLANGTEISVRPVCALLKDNLDDQYTPEAQQPITGVHPDVVRMLARKIATRKTHLVLGMNACKIYHGDLIERAMCLVLAVSGNWGKKGTGLCCWAAGMHDGAMLAMAKTSGGAQATETVLAGREEAVANIKKIDPTMTTEIAMLELTKGPRGVLGTVMGGAPDEAAPMAAASTPAYWWYFHGGYDKRWNNPDWGDDSLPRTFDDYFNEAREKGWWNGLDHPRADEVPQVLIECGGNMLRRSRGGKKALLDTLWPKLKIIVTIDIRMTQTGLHSDYFLPAAQHYEKIAFANAGPYVMNLTMSDKAVEPAGESKNEWEIFKALLGKIAERAKARGLDEYTDPEGRQRRYGEMVNAYTMNGYYSDQERVADEQIRDSALAGTLPPGTSIETLREKGFVRFTDWGMMPGALSQASPFKTDETHSPFRNHVEDGAPYPTYCRRAQFYIDHEWFLEAGEQLPRHKPNPSMGGDYPLGMTSGHNRWSVHSMNHMNKIVLGTHRGAPNVMVNSDDAAARGVVDDDLIRVFNDVSEFEARAKVAANVSPGQIVSYNGWEPLQYANWSGANEIEPGMVKWSGFSGGYGHINFSFLGWQPVPIDRWVRCDFETVAGH
ncbi:MAG: molybdopterin dinucleotide binding domain-containing protein, partial [Pseudomonadales bacterium]